MLGEFIKLTASDGFVLNAYKAAPKGKPKGGVVVVQEVFGLNRWICSEVDRYAAEGYLAVCPATLDRVELGYVTDDYSQATFAKVGELMKAFKPELVRLDVAAAIAEVRPAGKVGITGYCFGGAVSWRSANLGLGLSAASGYYGGNVPSYLELDPQIPLEMHYGDKDTGIPVDQVEQLRKRHPDVPIYLYPGVHGFCNADRPQNYDAPSAQKANARTLEFFAKHLG
jgi:carboxymethylenebutenolidase